MAVVPPNMRRSETTIRRSFVQDVKRAFFSHLSVPGVAWVELLTWGPKASRRVFPDGLYAAFSSAGELTSDAAKRLERERRRQSFRVIRGGKREARRECSSSPRD
jgi:hypothetical protein